MTSPKLTLLLTLALCWALFLALGGAQPESIQPSPPSGTRGGPSTGSMAVDGLFLLVILAPVIAFIVGMGEGWKAIIDGIASGTPRRCTCTPPAGDTERGPITYIPGLGGGGTMYRNGKVIGTVTPGLSGTQTFYPTGGRP